MPAFPNMAGGHDTCPPLLIWQVIIDTAALATRLPEAVLAFFYVAEEADRLPALRERRAHAHFLRTYGVFEDDVLTYLLTY